MSELKRVIKRSKSRSRVIKSVLFQTTQKTYMRLNEACNKTDLTKRDILEAALKDALDKILK